MAEITDEHMLDMLTKTKTYTLVLIKQGPGWDTSDRDRIIWEHGRRNFSLRADGVLAIVCPVPDDTELCGLYIFDADEGDAARIMDDDPGVRAGVFQYEVHPARSFPGDRLPG